MTATREINKSKRLRVRVNDELLLDTGTCAEVARPYGPEWLIQPPQMTLFHQELDYLRAKPDPPKRPSGSLVGREGVAAAALVLRGGSCLAVLLDRDKPVPPEVRAASTSRRRKLPEPHLRQCPREHIVAQRPGCIIPAYGGESAGAKD